MYRKKQQDPRFSADIKGLLVRLLMGWLSRRVSKIWRACDSPSRKNSTSHLFWLVQTCPKLFTPVYNFSHHFPPVLACSHLFTPVHNCSHLFTPQWLSTLFSQWQFLLEFSPGVSCYFSIICSRPVLSPGRLMCYLVEIAYFCSPNRELSNSARLE